MKCGWLALTLTLLVVAGCPNPQPYADPVRLEGGLVIVLPGIEGPSRLNREICHGLDEGGVDCAIETYRWTTWLGPLWNLRATARNYRKARDVADRVVRYQESHPGQPVFLVGHSGGGAIAVWAAESLPPEHKVDGIILLAISLSPHYRLERALGGSRLGIVSFHSDRDWVLLATYVAGTMDGELSSSAGRTGFVAPEGASKPASYARLQQIPWDPEMARAGYTGGHLTSGAAGFVARYVAPLLALPAWDEKSVTAVMASGNGQLAPASGPGEHRRWATTRPSAPPVFRLPATHPAGPPVGPSTPTTSPSRRLEVVP